MNMPGLPGGPQLQPPQIQPMQEIYPQVNIDIQTTPTGDRALVIQCMAPNKVMIFPMSVDIAETVGRKLSAPSIVVANGNGHISG